MLHFQTLKWIGPLSNVQEWKSTLLGVILDHFVLEWKSALKIVESTPKIVESILNSVIQTATLDWIPL